MAHIFRHVVYADRTIKLFATQPMNKGEKGINNLQFVIPKRMYNLPVYQWVWWFVYVNAKNQKFTVPLVLSDYADDPNNYCVAQFDVDFGITLESGWIKFSLEAVDADSQGVINHRWRSNIYRSYIGDSLEGNQIEYDETESDIISALIQQVQNKVNSLVGGATPLPVQYKSQMTDHDSVYLYVGTEQGEYTNYWYYWNGSDFVHGGVYASGITVDAVPTQGSLNVVSSGGVYSALAGKIAKPLTSPNGTNGQLLRTNGDGTTQWVDEGLPTDEQTETAVNAWLDEHPEATTTVEDGSITQAKLHGTVQNEINSKASAINTETEQSELHENVSNAISVEFVGNNLAFSTAKYANAKNIMPKITREWTAVGVSLIASGNFIVYNGTATSNGPSDTRQVTYPTPIPAGQYKWHINLSSVLPDNSRFIMWVKYDVENPSWVEVANKWVGTSVDNIIDITFENNVKTILFRTGIVSGLTYDNFKVWCGLFDASVNIVDTGLSVLDSETVTYSDNSLSENRTIDTMQHESTVLYVADTKKYIDEHIPNIIGYWSDNIYALPENFGAVGDGVADDTQAIGACLAYASQSNKDVKGYNKYKITQTIALSSNVYLKEIVYTGSDYAIDIQHNNIAFEFESITSANGGGICFGNNSQETTFARQCKITGVAITSYKNCILAKNKTLYCVCDIKLLSSTNENCIEFSPQQEDAFIAGEYVFENCKCACPNGYVAKNPNDSKLYNFTVERDCKYGLLNPKDCVCVGWRHAEQTDCIAVRVFNGDSERTNGALIVYDDKDDKVTAGFYGLKFISSLSLPWYAIDMSAIQNYDRIRQDDDNPTDKWHTLAYTGIELGTPVRGCFSSGKNVIGNKVYFIGGHKVFVPEGRCSSSITVATCDFRLLESQTDADIYVAKDIVPMMGTDFSIDIAHTDIYFNASFGAIGYNDLTVNQHDGNTCTIYDKLGNVLFDGTNLGDGKWSLKCSIDRSSFGRLDITTAWWCYDGTNEKWEITKLA